MKITSTSSSVLSFVVKSLSETRSWSIAALIVASELRVILNKGELQLCFYQQFHLYQCYIYRKMFSFKNVLIA